jgi:hypothetical protein
MTRGTQRPLIRKVRVCPQGVRDFYDRAPEECWLIYTGLPTPRKIQTLVQVWKQLRKWNRPS